MSRVIKFRGWDSEGQLMIYQGANDTFDMDGNDRSYETVLTPHGQRAFDEITIKDTGELERDTWLGPLMQFTGLKDKNGVDIYEGDVVMDYEGKSIVKFGWARDSEVYGDSYGWYLEPLADEDGYKSDDRVISGSRASWAELFEVVGNIYENPDLLERSS